MFFSLSPIYIYLYVLSFLHFTTAAVRITSNETYFTHPASSTSATDTGDEGSNGLGLSYALGSVQDISWVTDLDVFNVILWQRSGESNGEDEDSEGGVIFAKTKDSDPVTTFSWVVQMYGLDLDVSSTFYLAIEGDGGEYTSAEFNISSTSTSTSSTTPTPTNSDNENESPASTETGTETASSLTSTGKIALGLGAGIGTPLISLLAILAYFQYRSIRRNAGTHLHPPDPYTHPHLSHQPSMSGGGGGYYPSAPPAPSPIEQQQYLQIPPSILPPSQIPTSAPLYRTANLVPSELPQKLARPVNLPPWEVHSDSVLPPPPQPPPKSRERSGTGTVDVDIERGIRNGNGNEDADKNMNENKRPRTAVTSSTVGMAITTPSGNWPGLKIGFGSGSGSAGGTRSTSLWEHRASGPKIPELHGDSANFI